MILCGDYSSTQSYGTSYAQPGSNYQRESQQMFAPADLFQRTSIRDSVSHPGLESCFVVFAEAILPEIPIK